jgi:geranylgeranyl reductase family protein
MDEYDVIVVGGGIAGSVAARFSAEHGFKTLLLEKYKTPRNKPCSGIQFAYFEKLLGEKIPQSKLCKNQLFKVEMITPKGKTLKGKMKMLNFWRSTFDSWLNTVAVKAGAEFQDDTSLVDFKESDDGLNVTISTQNSSKQIKTLYLIAADGMLSKIRQRLQPEAFNQKSLGTAINYYFQGEGSLDPNTLYMYYNRDFCPLMFAWIYQKDDQWIIGTGANQNVVEYAERFFNHAKEKYALQGKIVRKEGFASTQKIETYLGKGNILMVGDAAGLVDLYRGVGMDTAALSGRLAIKSILTAEKKGTLAIDAYQQRMAKVVRKLETNAEKQNARYASNETLEQSLSTLNLLRDGISMIVANQINKLLPTERVILLPT